MLTLFVISSRKSFMVTSCDLSSSLSSLLVTCFNYGNKTERKGRGDKKKSKSVQTSMHTCAYVYLNVQMMMQYQDKQC